jgi:tetratricopeptide (TPR) repeat protein
MARKKRRDRDNRKKRRREQPSPGNTPPLPNRRALEGVMQQFVVGLQGEAGHDTPLVKAQALMYRAFEESDEHRRVHMAIEALALSPDCADAYVVMAENAPSRKEALRLYQDGVAAGERALGPEAFQRDVGHFWGILETRPYMRAREGLADLLWTLGRRDEAVQHLQDMLRLNPGDNQGIRYTLAGFLLFLDRDGDLAGLLRQYSDDGLAAWAYTKALLAFRQHGDTPEARELLEEAKQKNKHVPDYLLGRKYPPPRPPGPYSPGDESEALNYIGSFLPGWAFTPGAISWLRQNDDQTKKRKAAAPHPKGPLGFIKKWLKQHLPQEFDVWQADCRPLPNWIRIGGEPVRLWLTLVTSRSNDLVLAHQIGEEEPAPALLWDTLVQAMQYPAASEPHRPTELQVRPDERWQSLRTHLEEIGFNLTATEELDQLERVFKGMSEQLAGKPRPGLLDMPGITPEQAGSFYEAAATFFRAVPWKKVGYEAAIKVECEKFQSSPWYAVLMGQSGLTIGLAVYEDLGTLRRLWARDRDEEENVRETVGTSVLFGEESDLSVADVEAARRHGWPVARPDAYPGIFHKERGRSLRQPLAWELDLMEGCLRSIPDFVNRHAQDDPTPEDVTVPVASGELRLWLSWVVEDEVSVNG